MKKSQLFWLDWYAKRQNTEKLQKCLRKFADNAKISRTGIELFEAKHADVIVKEFVSLYYPLSEDALLKVFDLPNAKDILAGYAPHHQLPKSVEAKLFDKPDMREILKAYISKQHISDDAAFKLFEQPDAHELLMLYLSENKHELPSGFDIPLLDMPNCEALLEAYKKHGYGYWLSEEAQLKMFTRADVETLLGKYDYHLCEQAELKLFDLPNAATIVAKYIEDFSFDSPEAEAKLFELENAAEIIDKYVTHYSLYEDCAHLLLKLPDGVNRMICYMQNYYLEPKTLEAFFNHPAADRLLSTAMQEQSFPANLEQRLFERPDAFNLLKAYIEKNELTPDAQLMFFSLPAKEAKELLSRYAEKYDFSHKVMQKLAVSTYFRQN